MTGFLIRVGLGALGLWLAAKFVPGVSIHGATTLALAALLHGLVNAFVRPVIVLLTLPFTIVTLGLFLLVVNGAMLGLVAFLLEDFRITGLLAAVLGAIVVSVTGGVGSWIFRGADDGDD